MEASLVHKPRTMKSQRRSRSSRSATSSAFNKNDIIHCIEMVCGKDVKIMYKTGYSSLVDWCNRDHSSRPELIAFHVSTIKTDEVFYVFYKDGKYNVESKRKNEFTEFPNHNKEHLKDFQRWLHNTENLIAHKEACQICFQKIIQFNDPFVFNNLYHTCKRCNNVVCIDCTNTMRLQGTLECAFCKAPKTYWFVLEIELHTMIASTLLRALLKNTVSKEEVFDWIQANEKHYATIGYPFERIMHKLE